MKKILVYIALLAATSATALQPFTEQFLNGSGIVVSNNTTVYPYSTDVYVFGQNRKGGVFDGLPELAYKTYSQYSYYPAYASNSASGFYPGTQYWTNLTIAYTNNQKGMSGSVPTYYGGYVINTNTLYGPPWSDVPAFADADGNAGQGCLSVSIAGAALTQIGITTAKHITDATNTVTLVFVPVYNGTNAVNDSAVGVGTGSTLTEGVDKLTLLAVAGGATSVTIKTNLTADFMKGAQRIRLVSVASDNVSSGVPVVVKNVTLSGWRP